MNGVPLSAVELPDEQWSMSELPKALTGIRGLDEITRGGLPKSRPTLVCGGPGSGKTLLALTFPVNGVPIRPLVGDLSNRRRVLVGLDLVCASGEKE